ncbi:TIGR04104 family putative zinc finger protein [Halobacillus rhizosphaerae]|uniref:TIGR04104 family putative zinc finger protein n=1 Tax=Halobacillus rhizosphaerae TaxID=3064889 RepID=UPI00398B2D6B
MYYAGGVVNLIQKCQNCGQSFSWTHIYLSLWMNYKPILCKECGQKHRLYFYSRLINSLFIIPIALFIPFANSKLELSQLFIVTFAIIYFVLTSLPLPYLMKYKSVASDHFLEETK